MRNARFLVWPSQGYYETFGLVALEAFSLGVPVLTSRLGVNCEIVADGRTGLHFSPGDPGDIARRVRRAWSSERDLRHMGRQARIEFETRYGADENYVTPIDIYRAALSRRHDTPPTDPPDTHPNADRLSRVASHYRTSLTNSPLRHGRGDICAIVILSAPTAYLAILVGPSPRGVMTTAAKAPK